MPEEKRYTKECSVCREIIEEQAVINYSNHKYGRSACRGCQKVLDKSPAKKEDNPSKRLEEEEKKIPEESKKVADEITESSKKVNEEIKKVKNVVNSPQRTTETNESEDFITLNGKKYILFKGLLKKAHDLGLKSIQTERLTNEGDTIIFKAIVELEGDKIFTAHGDANKENTGSLVSKHMLRMSETRAISRALRFATNTGETSADELGSGDNKE